MTSRSVLIVDSDAASRKLERVVLRKAGWFAQVVETADDARRALASFLADVVIITLAAAERDQLVAELRERGIAVVLVSAVDTFEARQRAAACGCAGYIAKPIDILTFSSQLEAFLGAKP